PREFITMGPQGPYAVAVLREEIDRQWRLINPSAHAQPTSSSSSSRTPMLIAPEVPAPSLPIQPVPAIYPSPCPVLTAPSDWVPTVPQGGPLELIRPPAQARRASTSPVSHPLESAAMRGIIHHPPPMHPQQSSEPVAPVG